MRCLLVSEYQCGAPWCQNINAVPPGVRISMRCPWCQNINAVPPGVRISMRCLLVSEYQCGASWCQNINVAPPGVSFKVASPSVGISNCWNIKVVPPGVRKTMCHPGVPNFKVMSLVPAPYYSRQPQYVGPLGGSSGSSTSSWQNIYIFLIYLDV